MTSRRLIDPLAVLAQELSGESPERDPSPRRKSEDPFAELARLAGQEDPFANFIARRPALPPYDLVKLRLVARRRIEARRMSRQDQIPWSHLQAVFDRHCYGRNIA